MTKRNSDFTSPQLEEKRACLADERKASSAPPLRVSTDLLYTSMRLIRRKDLDNMPMVSRHFYHIVLGRDPKEEREENEEAEKKSPKYFDSFPQNRTIVRITFKPAYEEELRCLLAVEKAMAEENKRVFSLYPTAPMYNFLMRTTTYRLSAEQFREFLNYTPNLRAREMRFNRRLTQEESQESFTIMKRCFGPNISQLWDGGKLTFGKNGRHCYLPNKSLLGNCAAIEVLGDYCNTPMFRRLKELRYSAITLLNCGLNSLLTFEDLLDYLLPVDVVVNEGANGNGEGSDCHKGEPEMKLRILNLTYERARRQHYAPSLLKRLLEERLKLFTPAKLPNFLLQLRYNYPESAEGNSLGEFQLLQKPDAVAPTNSTTISTPDGEKFEGKGPSCTFVAKYVKKWRHYDHKCLSITVKCSKN